MDERLAQMVAQQLQLGPQELAALKSGDLYSVLAPRLATNPAAMAVLSAHQRSRAAEAQVEAAPEPQPPPRQPSPELVLASLKEANRALLRLAGLLGACRCFGTNAACPRCAGQGAPGFVPPADPATFLTWAARGLHHLGYQVAPAQPQPVEQVNPKPEGKSNEPRSPEARGSRRGVRPRARG